MKIISLHYRGFVSALGRIIKNPFEHLLHILTIAVIITALGSVLAISQNINYWQKNSMNFPQVVVYLKSTATQSDISLVENAINKFGPKYIKNYQFISKADGLKELENDESLKQIASDVATSNDNPIPDVLVINTNTADDHYLKMLQDKISKLNQVDDVQMDTNYANKITELAGFIAKISQLLQIAFAVSLVIIIYNMIRLQMLLRQDEIIVSRLIGASDSFIMRPLAYYAVLQILIGSTIAVFMVNLFIRFINNMFLNFTNLFGHTFLFSPLNNLQIAQIIGILVIFGIFGVFLAVRWVFRNSYAA